MVGPSLRILTRRLVAVSMAGLLMAACGANESSTPTVAVGASSPSPSPAMEAEASPTPTIGVVETPHSEHGAESESASGDETVRVVSQLAQMWGHLEASAANADAGNWAMAGTHAGHPVGEYWDAVKGTLAEAGVDQEVRQALDAYQQAVDDRSNQIDARLQDARKALQDAMSAVAGEDWQDPKFRGEVLRDLLEAVEHEYGEAVQGKKIANLEEYQDAWGFLQVADDLYGEIAGDVRSGSAEAAEEIDHELEELRKAFPQVTLENARAELSQVEEAVGEVRAELAKALGIQVSTAQGPEAQAEEIKGMVEEALSAYKAGNTDEAYEHAANSYLEGFEHMEGDLLQQGQRELVEDLELKFKDLRDAIRAGKPASEVEAIAEEIEQGLDQAVQALK